MSVRNKTAVDQQNFRTQSLGSRIQLLHDRSIFFSHVLREVPDNILNKKKH